MAFTASKLIVCAMLCAAAGLEGCERIEDSGKAPSPVVKLVEQRIPAYFQRAASLPPSVIATVKDVESSPVPGLLSATLELTQGTQSQEYPITVSRDGRYLIQGRIIDLTSDPYVENMEKIALDGQPMRGNPDASVTIVEYSDFQCPFCAKAYETLEKQLLVEYGDRVRLVYKNFPLTSVHPWAQAAAVATVCGRQQSPEAFWKLYDYFFQNQASLTPQNLAEKAQAVARAAGLDVARFDACMADPATLEAVEAEEKEAAALGVRSTPTFFVNGRRLEGAQPYETFKEAVEAALRTAQG
jgi:protein-disulfide isomerase